MKTTLRFIEENDLDFITEIRKDPSVSSNLGTFLLPSKERQKIWFDSLIKDNKKMYLILEDGKKKIGYVRMTEIDYINRSICVGGDIHKKHRGRGYGNEMYEHILDLCFNDLCMHRVYLFVLEANKKAINLYSKFGFKEEGRQREAIYKYGSFHDYIMMSILSKEYRND